MPPAALELLRVSEKPYHIPEENAWEDAWETDYLLNETARLNIEIRAKIKYIDRKQQYSEREVQIMAYFPRPNGDAILAFCELRQAKRSFLVDSIMEFIDLETGEFVPDVRHYINNIYDQSPKGKTQSLLKEERDHLCVLMFIARVDGQFRAKQVAVLYDYFSRNSYSIDATELKAAAGKVFPTAAEYRAALKGLKALDADSKAALVAGAEAMAATRAKAAEMTRAAIETMKKRLG